MEGADLSETNLVGAKLTCARLIDTNLKNANLAKANLANAIYEVKFDHLPDIVSMSQANGLELMQYCESPHALEQLKNAFKLGGWRQKEREITFAIKQTKQNKYLIDKNYPAFIFNFLFFDLTTNFGLYPGKALRILIYLIPIFTLIYMFAIWRSSDKHSIYRVWPKDRIEIKEGQAVLEDSTRLERLKIGHFSLISSLHFSLHSAFNIGWRELNIGNWLNRLQLHPYSYQATGWVRSVSGFQSLISVLLLAMWAISYFGRPFD